jgi:hypothetical protein
MLWVFLGMVLGYAIGRNNREDPTKSLEHATEQIKRLEQDVAYYKKLNKSLIEDIDRLKKGTYDAS